MNNQNQANFDDKYFKRERDSESIITHLDKENQALKSILKSKGVDNKTLDSLLAILELQRERINFLEEGKKIICLKFNFKDRIRFSI
jgi:hypothetical protein